MWLQPVLLGGAMAGAAGFGAALGTLWRAARQRARYRASLRSQREEGAPWLLGAAVSEGGAGSVDGRVIAFATTVDQRVASPRFLALAPQALRARPWMEGPVARAGLEGQLGSAGFWETRVRLGLAGALGGGAVGLLVSGELGLIMALGGLALGWRALPRAIRQRERHRAEAMERDLSEMLDVVALGMRSGLSFDRSLQLYTEHFQTLLAASFRSAFRQWACGLASREEALRATAASYDSSLLGRVVENIVRSLRFGSTLADNLEDAAREARAAYRARKQEQVAKAPVKMMIPTGVLILPAMLMLVLGPVLLELAGGF